MNNTSAMITQTKGEFLSDCLVETLNDFWKVNANLNLVVLFILNWRLKLVGNMLRSGVSLLVPKEDLMDVLALDVCRQKQWCLL